MSPAKIFSMRDLRNHTADVMASARLHGEVTITSYGHPVAKLVATDRPSWAAFVEGLLVGVEPRDTGWLAELETDDAASMDDLS